MHIEAIVIRKRPIREHDQLVVLYSRELGKVSAIAKGSLRAHSRQALALDEGSHIHCELVDGRIGSIMTGTQAVHSMSGAKEHVCSWAAVQFFLQVVDVMVFEAQPDEALWACLLDILFGLDTADAGGALAVYRTGQQQLLRVLGYGSLHAQSISIQWARSELDEQFEMIAHRRLSAIDLFYDVAVLSRS